MPIRQCTIELDVSTGRKLEEPPQLRIEAVRSAVHVAIGRRAHIAALAGEHRPAALRRADHGVIGAERIEEAVIVAHLVQHAARADVMRDRGEIARAVDDQDHHRAVVIRERRNHVGKERVALVMRQADDRHGLAHPEQRREPLRS
jgi:hypothetical protein